MEPKRVLRWGGVVGPAGFVTAWATAGALTEGYSPTHEAISRLGAARAPKRGLMTAGFVCFGVGVPAYSVALRDSLGGRAWLAATVTGLATLGAGAFPLDNSTTVDRIHYGLAAVGSSSLALTPILAAQTLSARGHDRVAAASLLVGVASGACLAATALVSTEGLWQRIGLTLGEVWIAASALSMGGLMEPCGFRPLRPRSRV